MDKKKITLLSRREKIVKKKQKSKKKGEQTEIVSERETAKDGECLPVPVVNALEVTVEG